MPQTEPSPPAANPRRFRWRRLVQFRLRTLLIWVFVLSILFALYAWESKRVSVRELAMQKIEGSGGFVVYDHLDTGWRDAKPVPGPWIQRRLFGVASVAKVGRIQFQFNRVPTLTEEEIVGLLQPFRDEVKHLDFSEASVTDRTLNELVRYPRLKTLGLCWTRTTNDAVLQFAKARPDVWITHPALNGDGSYNCYDPTEVTTSSSKKMGSQSRQLYGK